MHATEVEGQVEKLEDQAHVRRLVEVVLAPRSELIHKTIRETRFRTQYNAAVIGVHRQDKARVSFSRTGNSSSCHSCVARANGVPPDSRNGHRLVSRIGDIRLEAGDVLLLDAGPGFVQMYKNNRIFALVAELDNSTPPQFQKVWIAGAAAGTMIILASADLVHLVIGGLFASMIMIVAGVISVPQVIITKAMTCASPLKARLRCMSATPWFNSNFGELLVGVRCNSGQEKRGMGCYCHYCVRFWNQ